MNLDHFLKSQTFRTGVFVLFVLFVLLVVFKLGVLHGYKKAHFSHTYGAQHHRVLGSTFFSHQKGMFDKRMLGDFSFKRHLIKVEALSDFTVKKKSDAIDLVE